MPAVVFAVVLCWPWLDAFLSKDARSHDVLVPPSAAPWRTGIGAALIFAGIVLTLAAADDQQAFTLHVPVQRLVTFYRILLPVGSLAFGFLAAVFAREVRERTAARGIERERVVALRRTAEGGFAEEEPQDQAEAQPV